MLSIHEVNRYMEHKKRESTGTFELIYERCNMTLLKYAKNGQYRFFYEVPEFILGVPLYKLNDAIKYVMDKLLKNGFLVKYYFPKYLYISWNYDEVNKETAPNALPQSTHVARIQSKKETPMIEQRFGINNKKDTPILSFATANRAFLPPPAITSHKNTNAPKVSVVMPHTPSYELPPPQSSGRGNTIGGGERNDSRYGITPLQKTNFVKSIADYKPSGKFTLNIT